MTVVVKTPDSLAEAWEAIMSMKCCASCRFFDGLDGSFYAGYCKRNPPTLAPILSFEGVDRGNESERGCWPWVEFEDLCGAWERGVNDSDDPSEIFNRDARWKTVTAYKHLHEKAWEELSSGEADEP